MTRAAPDHEWELLRAIDPLPDEHPAPLMERDYREALFLSIVESDREPRRHIARAALERVSIPLQPGDAVEPSHMRWRLGRGHTRVRLAAAASLVAAVVAFVVVNLLPATHTPGGVGDAWAKRVIAHAAAAVTGSGQGILHIQETVTVNITVNSPAPGAVDDQSTQVESWEQQTPPYDYWETTQSGSDTTTTTVIGDEIEHYDASRNTLVEGTKGPNSTPAAGFDPAYRAALALLRSQGAGTAPTSGSDGQTQDQFSGSLSDLITLLLKAPGLSVDSGASLDGASAISITGNDGRETLYIQPGTYEPLEFVQTLGEITGGGTPPVRSASAVTFTTRFNTYQTLPSGSVSPPNLKQLHPNATIGSIAGL